MTLFNPMDPIVIPGLTTGVVSGTHIFFVRERSMETGVTQVWLVRSNTEAARLGSVRWFGRWRKYGFFPDAETVYEEVCLGEIIELCKELSKTHRAKRKQEKEAAKCQLAAA